MQWHFLDGSYAHLHIGRRYKQISEDENQLFLLLLFFGFFGVKDEND